MLTLHKHLLPSISSSLILTAALLSTFYMAVNDMGDLWTILPLLFVIGVALSNALSIPGHGARV